MNFHRSLIVGRGGKNLGLGNRNRGVTLNNFSENSSQSFDSERKRSYVQKQNVFNVALQNSGLNRSADCHHFVRIDGAVGFFAEKFFNFFLNQGHSGLAPDQNHFINLVEIKSGALGRSGRDCFSGKDNGTLHQIPHQIFKFGPRQFHQEMFRSGGVGGNERNINLRFHRGRKFVFGFLGGFFQTLERQRVFGQINSLGFFKFGRQMVYKYLVEIIAAQMRIAANRPDFHGVRAYLQDRNVESAAPEIVDCDFLIFSARGRPSFGGPSNPVSQGGRGRFRQDSFHVKAGDFARGFGGGPLGIVKISWNSYQRLGDFLAELGFGVALQLSEHHGGELFRPVPAIGWRVTHFHLHPLVLRLLDFIRQPFKVAPDFLVRKLASDKPFHRKNSILGVGNGLALCQKPHHPLSGLGNSDHGRRGPSPFLIFQNARLAAFHDGHGGVSRSQINSQNFWHNFYLISPLI